MTQEIPAFSWAEGGQNATDSVHEAGNSHLGRLAQMRLQFAEGLLNRIEIR
jgi:hypothetical protein